MISNKMYNKISCLGFEIYNPNYVEQPDGRMEETITVSRVLPGESLRDEEDPKYFDYITTYFDLRASSDEGLIRSLHEWYDRPDLRINTLIAYRAGYRKQFGRHFRMESNSDEIPSFTIAELESAFKALLDITVESLDKEDAPEPDKESFGFEYDELVDWFLMNANAYRLTPSGKIAVRNFIDMLRDKRKEILDAGKDTCDNTDLPTEEDILSDISEFEEFYDFDDLHHDFFYSNSWGCTDNTDLGIVLERNKDYIVVKS